MSQTNQERVNRAMQLLKEGLAPFVEREMEVVYKDAWADHAPRAEWKDGAMLWDVANLLSTMWDNWQDVFRSTLGHAERSLTSELREWRNKWAHQHVFSTDDAYRCMDSAERLLKAISAPESAEVEKQKQELLRVRFEEQARKETRRAATTSVESQPTGGLRCWRDVVMPHPDVASGRYQQAEFAADLGQVYRGEGSDEYRDPVEFFRRTYLTEGLRMLLVGALKRLGGVGGDPVVELQTNFGGGKTHSMLALFHVFSGRTASDLAGIEPVLQEAGIAQPPRARRAVFVGHDPSLAHVNTKPDGTIVHTMWGEIAWQLLGKEGYEILRAADETGMSPGSSLLRELFTRATPCLILIDEWIVFVRQLYGKDRLQLPAGSFDANLAFAQSLTEAAKAVPGTLVVASIPSSDIEVGGEGGKEALTRLKNTFGRLESAWRPASAEEGFEIVRRRLFQPITDPQLFKARDAVVRAFAEMYRQNAQEFPMGVGETDYERQMRDAYPIHPELFERLYQDWGSLDKFQRTRGVLRLMAAVIYDLWDKSDASLMILPAMVPIAANSVQYELTRYMDDPWIPVIEKDVDGPHALPNQIDRDNPNMKRFSACLRVARTLYLGSAPTLHTGHRGIEDKRIRLGCVQPGESVSIFGDALRRLTDQATHLYVDGRRYWYSTQPSVTRMALERAEQYKEREEDVHEEIKKRIREELKNASLRGDFQAVYVAPAAPGDVPDEMTTRLVILGPDQPHSRGVENSNARKHAALLLSQRGTGLRNYANTLVFLGPDQSRLDELQQATRQYLAWQSIRNEQDGLELTTFQKNQVKTKLDDADDATKQRIGETYQWLFVPDQPDPDDQRIVWEEMRLQGTDALAVRASKKLRADGILALHYAGASLRHELDKVLWKNADHIGIKQLMEYFAKYLYLPRLRDSKVLLDAIQDGLNLMTWHPDTFAFADRYDEQTTRYHGLRSGQIIALSQDGSGLLVKPEVAVRQIEADKAIAVPQGASTPSTYRPGPASTGGTGRETPGTGTLDMDDTGSASPTPRQSRRFHGSVSLDPMRLSRDAGTINQEVIQHLVALMSAKAHITLEIQVDVADGVPDNVIRIVTENCRTLKFTSHDFEEE